MRTFLTVLLLIVNLTVLCFCSETVPTNALPQLNNDSKYQAELDKLLANKPKESAPQKEKFTYLYKLSYAYGNMRQYSAAEQTLRILISYYPNMAFLHTNLSVYLGKQGKYKEAKKEAEKALSLDPDYVHAKWVMLSWQWNLGDHEMAAKYFNSIPVPRADEKALLSLYYGCMACFFADVGDEKKVKYAITKRFELNDSPESRAFFERDIAFDKYRKSKWFIALVGKTLAESEKTPTESQ